MANGESDEEGEEENDEPSPKRRKIRDYTQKERVSAMEEVKSAIESLNTVDDQHLLAFSQLRIRAKQGFGIRVLASKVVLKTILGIITSNGEQKRLDVCAEGLGLLRTLTEYGSVNVTLTSNDIQDIDSIAAFLIPLPLPASMKLHEHACGCLRNIVSTDGAPRDVLLRSSAPQKVMEFLRAHTTSPSSDTKWLQVLEQAIGVIRVVAEDRKGCSHLAEDGLRTVFHVTEAALQLGVMLKASNKEYPSPLLSIIEQSFGTLRNLACYQPNQLLLCSLGCVEVAFSAVRGPHGYINTLPKKQKKASEYVTTTAQVHALGLASNIAFHRNNKEEVAQKGAIGDALGVINNYLTIEGDENKHSESILLQALAILWNVSDHQVNRRQLALEGGVPTLVKVLEKHRKDPHIVRQCFGALRNAACDRDNQEIICQLAYKSVTDLVEKYSKFPKVCEQGLAIIRNLADSEAHRAELAGKGAIELVLRVFRGHMADTSVCEQAAGALRNFACAPVNTHAIELMGGVEHLATAFSRHIKSVSLCEQALASLRNILGSLEVDIEALVEVNGIVRQVVAALEYHISNYDMCKQAIGFLHTISGAAVSALEVHGVIEIVISVLKVHDSLLLPGATLLTRLATLPRCRGVLLSELVFCQTVPREPDGPDLLIELGLSPVPAKDTSEAFVTPDNGILITDAPEANG